MADKTRPAKTKIPRKITESSLRNIALYYLQRYASSKENVRRVLMRRVHRSALVHEDLDTDEAARWVDQLVEQLAKSGMIDDEIYAEGQMKALFRRGISPRVIAQRLAQKGIDAELVQKTISKLNANSANPKMSAAIKFAKRRRFGPYQTRGDRNERTDKDMAAFARAGFDYETARKVLSSNTIDELEDLAAELSG